MATNLDRDSIVGRHTAEGDHDVVGLECDVGDVGALRSASDRRWRHRCGLLDGRQPRLELAVDGPADAVGDVGEAAGEVEQQDEQTDARREQRDDLVVGEQRRYADDVDGTDDRTGQRAHTADDDHRHEQERSGDGVSGVGERHPLGDAGQQTAAEPGDRPRQREGAELHDRRANGVGRCCGRVVADREGDAADRAPAQAAEHGDAAPRARRG